MINLRFHIVSIVAIFLALAIGMLAGSTLLDRATVDVLKNRQRSLDARNSRLRDENDRLRAAIESRAPAQQVFGTQTLPALVPGLLTDAPSIILAARGINEDSVRALQSEVRDAGGSPLGVVWFDSRFDLDNTEALSQIGAALSLGGSSGKVTRTEVVKALVAGLTSASSAAPSTTTTTVPVDPTATTLPSSEPISTSSPDDPSLSVLSKLVDAELVDWESPTEGEPGSRTLPSSGLRVILLSGEGSDLRPGRLMYPLARALGAARAGIVVGEVRNPRTDLEAIDDTDTPERGAFVDSLRSDDTLSKRIITVDNVDEPFGRLAVVLALSKLPTLTSGSYGIASSADAPFPPASG
ncbi:MAG: copper transporter [Acidimicrobiales bacterium]